MAYGGRFIPEVWLYCCHHLTIDRTDILHFSVPLVASKQAAAGVILKLPGLVDILLQGLQRAMPGDGRELEHPVAVARRAGKKPAPQAVTGELVRIQAGTASILLDDQRHALGREGVLPNAIAAAHLPEHRALGDAGQRFSVEHDAAGVSRRSECLRQPVVFVDIATIGF